jgi:prepilin-type N-terminal cleavage/methylation domain-containing protein
MTRVRRHCRAFTLVEVTIVSTLMALLAAMLSSAWSGIGRPAAELIVRGRLYQEMDIAAASLTHDLAGSLANPEGRLGGKTQGRWLAWSQPTPGQLWLCYDGGSNPDALPDWGSPDTVITYLVTANMLKRIDQSAGTTFNVARYVDNMQITADGTDGVRIELTFKFRNLTRTCTLIARIP